MSENRGSKAASSLVFKLLESFGTQGVTFVVSIVLARILDTSDYRVLTLMTVFIAVSQVFVTSGMNMALIQKKEVDETDYSSAFWFSMGIAAVLYVLLFLLAPSIAAFYEAPLIAQTLRVQALVLFAGAFLCVQNAVIARTMTFRHLLYSSLTAAVISGAVGIVLAKRGAGCWALVFQQLTNQTVQAVALRLLTRWHPRFQYSWERVRVLFRYGWKLLVSSLLDTAYTKLRTGIIGKRFLDDTVSFYNRGQQFPELVMTAVNGSIQSVMLPVLSESQDDLPRVKAMMRRSVMVSSLLVLPLMAGLAAVARPLVLLLLTEKWLMCVPFLQIACIDFALYPIHTANLQAISALGRSDVFLILEIIKKVTGIILLVLSLLLFDSVYAIAWGAALNGLIGSVVNAWPNRRLLKYGYLEQVRDVLPQLLLSLVMFAAVSLVGLLPLEPLPLLALQVLTGVVVYSALVLLFRLESASYLINTVKARRSRV